LDAHPRFQELLDAIERLMRTQGRDRWNVEGGTQMCQQLFSQGLIVTWFFTLAMISPGAPSLSGQEVSIVGKWESVTRSAGGIGSTLDFHSDSKVSLAPGAMLDLSYRLDGTRLVMSFTDPGSGEVSENTVDVHISGDSMIQSDPESGQEIRLMRAQAAGTNTLPIVGKWSFTHQTGGIAFQVFTADGNMHLRVPFRTDRGTYVISADSLTILIEGQDPWQVRFAIDGTRLTLYSGDESPQHYNRVPW
jgi:hypothetical protein